MSILITLQTSTRPVFRYPFCVLCRQTKPIGQEHRDICLSCENALDFVQITERDGECPVCQRRAALWTSSYFAADRAWCQQHAILATRRHTDSDTDDHTGDVRNCAHA